MANKRTNLISFLLDRTGSMVTIWDSTIDGLNEFIDGQLAAKYKTVWNVTAFDSESIDLLREGVKGKNMVHVGRDEVSPRSMTPLHDAIGKTIKATDKLADDYDGVIFVILTDGLENASHEYGLKKVHKMIRKREDKRNWQFIFLGANMDAFVVGADYGIQRGQTVTFSPDDVSVGQTYAVAAAASTEYGNTGVTSKAHSDTRTDKDDLD